MTKTTNVIIYEQETPEIFQTLGSVHGMMAKRGFNKLIIHLVELRASQINQCAYCVKMHTAEARADGETSERLDRLVVWRHVDDFTNEEKSALAWTEALTTFNQNTDYAILRGELKRHFSDEKISVLTTAIAMINLWNRIQISKH